MESPVDIATARSEPIDLGEETLRLVDGRSVAVRPTRPRDADAIADLFASLSADSRAMRFGAARGPLTQAEAEAMARPPDPAGAGLVAVAGPGPERAVALARYERAAGAAEAEIAVAVDDDWQGLGVGTGLIERLIARAAADGLDALWAVVRPENHRMLTVFRTLGSAVEERRGRGEVLVRIPVGPDDAFEEAAVTRYAFAAAASLEPMFRPRSVAVVGASRDPSSPGGAVLRALLESSFPGPVYAINPASASVAGRPAYPSLLALPESPELVVIAVPAPSVPLVAREAAGRGARALIVLSSGFSEGGPQGQALDAELLHVARTSGMRLLGPNCLGLAVTDPGRPINLTFAPQAAPAGHIAFASQSGGLGIGALAFCALRGIGLSAFASLGNKADVSSNDLLAWWERDERTRAILLYLEGFGNPRRFARLARRVARTTPIVALKGGRGAAGAQAAGSHTAALAAGDEPTDALFDLAGVVRVDTVEELFETGQLLAGQPLPAGPRVAILSIAGGPAILAADACEAGGLVVPPIPEPLGREVAAAAPSAAALANPVDLGSGAGPSLFRSVGRLILDAGAADALLVIYTPTRGGDAAAVVGAVGTLADGRAPVIGCVLGQAPPPGPATVRWPVPWLAFPESAARALANAHRAAAGARRPVERPAAVPGVDAASARHILEAAPGEWLAPEAVTAVLAAYGIGVARSRRASSPEQASAAQAELGVPVAVKAVSREVVHKSDVGGVILDCASPDEAAAAYRRVAAACARAAGPDAMDGALVQEMAQEGPDLIVGATGDPVFGPLVLAGIGGAEAELWRDRAIALAPVGPATARELWERLRGAALLDGWRGAPAADRAALDDLVVRVGRLAAEQPLLAELDCNPVRSPGPGRGVLVLDARIRRSRG